MDTIESWLLVMKDDFLGHLFIRVTTCGLLGVRIYALLDTYVFKFEKYYYLFSKHVNIKPNYKPVLIISKHINSHYSPKIRQQRKKEQFYFSKK